MNNLEDSEILPDEILVVIDKLINYNPNFIFGGSIALNAVGLLNRKIKDIDIFVKEDYSICDNLFEVKTNVVSETVTDVNGEKITRVGFKINDINICIFRVKGESLQHSIFEFSRRKIKIQNCNHAIIAKLAYSKKRDKDNRPFPSTTKHIKDVEDIFGILDDIDNYVPKVSNGLR